MWEEIKWIIFESMTILITLAFCIAVLGYEVGLFVFIPFLVLCVAGNRSLRR